jgi:hypothetical protein
MLTANKTMIFEGTMKLGSKFIVCWTMRQNHGTDTSNYLPDEFTKIALQ